VAIGRNPQLLTSSDRLYLDHAATTPVLPEARAAVARALDEVSGIPQDLAVGEHCKRPGASKLSISPSAVLTKDKVCKDERRGITAAFADQQAIED